MHIQYCLILVKGGGGACVILVFSINKKAFDNISCRYKKSKAEDCANADTAQRKQSAIVSVSAGPK